METLTGHPVRSDYKQPGDPDILPTADAVAVVPASFNTINKLAGGISDTLALGVLNEAIGRELPIVMAPTPNAALARHPAFRASVATLRSWGVHVIFDPEKYPLPAPGTGLAASDFFPWQAVEAAISEIKEMQQTSSYKLTQGGGSLISGLLDEMAETYVEVYAEPPYKSGPLWQRDAFVDRTQRQATRPGYAIVVARSADHEMIGYSFGLTFPEGRWWSGNASQPPPEILAASKFALIELLVREPWRRQGIARQMHDLLLNSRPEPYAILTAVPAAPARSLYQRWGWKQIGTAQHTPDSPPLDALVLSLTTANGGPPPSPPGTSAGQHG